MAQLAKVHKSGVKYLIELSDVYTILDGPHTSVFKSYVVFLGHAKVSILINDWKDVSTKVKDNIWIHVKLLILILIDSKLLYIITNTYLLM